MATFRSVHLSFWTDTKVDDDFTPEDKYFYLYLLTNPHTNITGCFEINIKQMCRETGYNDDTILRLIARMQDVHGVIRYDKSTKELLIFNWWKYNWTSSEKLLLSVKSVASHIKNEGFRSFVEEKISEKFNNGNTVSIPYTYPMDTSVSDTDTDTDEESSDLGNDKKKEERHSYGEYGWVKLTDKQHEKLMNDLGEAELNRCIRYIDESAQITKNKNKWSDWNAVLRKCHREGWGVNRNGGRTVNGTGRTRTSAEEADTRWHLNYDAG